MQVSINLASGFEAPTWEPGEGSAQAVAGLLSRGGEIGPVLATRGDKLQFQSADWLFVKLDRPTHLIGSVLAHTFTEQHAGLVWLSDETRKETSCLIGFPLAVPITDAARYRQLLSGLATVYGALAPKDELRGWRVAGGGAAEVLSGQLDEKTVDRLAQLGQENKSHRANKLGYIRSSVRLERDVVVKCADGSEAALVSLVEGSMVYCPVHVDTLGAASVIGNGRTKAVQCPCCLRNYWNTPPKRGADFGHFRRVFDALRAQEDAAGDDTNARQFTLLREQYLPPLELRPGFTLVRSRKGSGKTEALKQLIETCFANNLSVGHIGHRRSLLRAASQRLGLDLYFETLDGGDGTTEFHAVKPTDRYAICLDSMPGRLRPNVHKFDVVLVDESEQVIRHLAGATLKKARRPAFLMLRHYLRSARSVYLLDADLGMLSLEMALGAANAWSYLRFIVNEPAVEAQEYDLLTTRESLMARLESALNADKKCYVATNSKKAAERIALWIAKRWKEKRVEVVTSDNSQTPRIQALLSNIAAEFQSGAGDQPALDVLIGSPSIGTGIDITFPGGATVVDHVFGLFESGITTHHDIDQQLARVRHPGKVSVWVNRNVMRYETDPAALKSELKSTVLRTDLLVDFTRDGLPVYSEGDGPLVDLWAEITSQERTSKNELFYHWTALREANGWTAQLDIASDEDKARGKNAMLEGKALRDAAKVARIMEAKDIHDVEAERLTELDRVGGSMTDDERASLEKYRLGAFYMADVDADLVAFDDDGRTRRQIEWLEIMVGNHNSNQLIDRYQIARKDDPSVVIFDRQFRCAKAEMLWLLLAAAGLLDAKSGAFNLDSLVSTESLGDFVACFKSNRKRVDSELELDMRRDIEMKPVQQLGGVLTLIGVELVLVATTKVNGKKRRAYRLNAEGLTELLEIVVRRQRQREEKRELKSKEADAEGDNAPPDVNDEFENELSPDDDRSDERVQETAAADRCNAPLAEYLGTMKANEKAAKPNGSERKEQDKKRLEMLSRFKI